MSTSRFFGKSGALMIAAAAGALCGVCATVIGADALGSGASKAARDPAAINGFSGENAEARARDKAFGITQYEDEKKVGGGGASEKVLVDNDAIRVNLVSFKKGFIRPGSLLRRNDQLLVYVDEGQYTILKSGDGKPLPNPHPSHEPPGSSVFHYADTVVTENHIDNDYRVLFIEVKKK